MSATGWTVNGSDLRLYGYDFSTRWGWDDVSSVRGNPIEVAYVDGAHMQSGYLSENVLAFQMTLVGVNPATGLVDSGKTKWEWYDDNLDTLKRLFGPESRDIRRTMPDASIRQYHNAYAMLGIQVRERGVGVAELVIPIVVPEGTSRDITSSTAGQTDATNVDLTGTGTVAIVVGGNVRTSPVITVTADTTTSGFQISFPDGATLAFTQSIPAGQSLVLNCAARTVTLNGANADAGLASVGRRAYWGFLEPDGSNSLAYSVTGGQFDLTVNWYNRWR